MKTAAVCAAVLLGTAVSAQQAATDAPGVILRGLDKINGLVYDIDLPVGETATFGALQISLSACRYPVGNPAGDAFAALRIRDTNRDAEVFSGWMIASTPALSAMDHARYDIWVMRCTTS
ncbi:DUF2155 domain-containing protein [uncultured Roseobacter sp.]|uniref:DUF2155 domain-containing protein n=1 Tax=uncultured Roseobacter sp. TaxID=114847 RepID=UPI002601DD96|nr:DUF2155 domain-containing protein [uncultured Roseobacter sp.]